jgi:hypothetical protein
MYHRHARPVVLHHPDYGNHGSAHISKKHGMQPKMVVAQMMYWFLRQKKIAVLSFYIIFYQKRLFQNFSFWNKLRR